MQKENKVMKVEIKEVLIKAEAIIFDMDGVIFDTEKVYLDVWSKVFEKYGYKMTKNIYVSVMGTGRENVKKVFKQEYGEDLPIEEMYKEKDELLFEIINTGKVPMKEGAYNLLSLLKNKGYKLALATSAKRNRVNRHLKKERLEYFFSAIITGDDIVKCKPNPEIFLKAASKLGVNNKKCIVIEDSSAGIEAAYNAGMIPIHIVDLKEADKSILEKSYISLKSINKLIEILNC